MTAQEKLHAVETAIRQELPRLMELREGVILKRKRHFELYSDYVIIKIKRDDFSTYTEIYGKHKGSFSIENEKLLDHFEIIGHDILISDVLEWLGRPKWDEMGKSNDYYISDEGMLIRKNQDTSYDFLCEVNLSKPRLADQSEKLWAFLYNLIKDN